MGKRVVGLVASNRRCAIELGIRLPAGAVARDLAGHHRDCAWSAVIRVIDAAKIEKGAKHREPIPVSVRRQVLTESGFRCGVPTCRVVIPLDLHHLVPVRDNGGNQLGNLLPLCPNCHALYERGTIPKSALDAYKAILVALNHAFDQEAISNLLFLRRLEDEKPRSVILSGDGLLIFRTLIAYGLFDFSEYPVRIHPAVAPDTRYIARLTEKGRRLVDAWRSGNKVAFLDAQNGRVDPPGGTDASPE